MSNKKDIFSKLNYADAFDKLNYSDLIDKTELSSEDKIIFSKDLQNLIREEFNNALTKIPIIQFVCEIVGKEIKKQEGKILSTKERLVDELDAIRDETNNIKKTEKEIKETFEKKYANLKNSILSQPRYEFGGYALTVQEETGPLSGIPTTLKFTNGFLVDNGSQSFSVVYNYPIIGLPVISGTSGSVLFVDSNTALAENNLNLFWDNIENRLGIGVNSSLASKIHVVSGAETEITSIFKGAASQTANLSEWQDSDSNILASVNSAGAILCSTINTGNGAVELQAGTYTPTLTNVANVSASTAYQCQFLRVGNTVTVSGKVDIDPILTETSTQVGISLPIASNLGAQEDCAGTAFASGIAGQGAAILGDATNNRAQMEWISVDVTNQPMYFSFSYEII